MLKQQTVFQPPVYIDDDGKIFTYPGVQNWGAIYAATYGKGLYVDTTFITVGIDPGNGNPVACNSLRIYPNPVKNTATVSFMLESKSNISFTIYDISGRTVKTFVENNVTSGEHKTIVDMNGLPAGTYLIQMKSKTGNAFGKLIKVN
jgi:flagellar hook assembly protein FlgD